MHSHAWQVPHESAVARDAGHCKHLMHQQSPSPHSHLQRRRTNPQPLGGLPQAHAKLNLEVLQLEFEDFRVALEEATGLEIEFQPMSSSTAAATALEYDDLDVLLTGPAE